MIGAYIFKFARKKKEASSGLIRTYLYQTKKADKADIKGSRIRAMIHWLRIKNKYKYILANGRGYYYSRNKEDVQRYLQSLSNRINSIFEVYRSFPNDNAPFPTAANRLVRINPLVKNTKTGKIKKLAKRIKNAPSPIMATKDRR